ncbi:MAG: glutamate racemase [Verrucomicrobiota bacterium]
MKDTIKALGVFDSGVGGLTVVKALHDLVAVETLIYLGDTARVPYGNKSPESVMRYSTEIANFLLQHNVEGIVTACNTASAHALDSLKKSVPLPVFGVIEPGVEAALEATQTGNIGIIGTAGTINSQAYQRELIARAPELKIIALPTPLLVPLIEEHWLDRDATRLILEEYLEPIVTSNVDTLVLACTHYPVLKPLLTSMLPEIKLVDSATTCARKVSREMTDRAQEDTSTRTEDIRIYLTDMAPHFGKMAEEFLGMKGRNIQVVSIS